MNKAPSILELQAQHQGHHDGLTAAVRAFGPQATAAAIPEILQRASDPSKADDILKLLKDYPEFGLLKTSAERRKFLTDRMREIRKSMDETVGKRERLDYLIRVRDAANEMSTWVCPELKLERPDGVQFRALRKAVNRGEAIYFANSTDAVLPASDFEKQVFCEAEILLIEHDWSAAFANSDLDDAPIRLPYEVCAFEFQVSGRRAIALATDLDGKIFFSPIVSTSYGWVIPDFALPASIDATAAENAQKFDRYIDLINLMASQIRAICIALDAEVASTEVKREPHAGPIGNNFHAAARTYRVVNLARRYARSLPRTEEQTGRRVRLHFRRGHWRHFENFKTWINWMLVGDPDLGFIDKHYRL